ncbi:hypothetical protein ACFVQB_19480 [Paenibacillus sp. NPDC057886]
MRTIREIHQYGKQERQNSYNQECTDHIVTGSPLMKIHSRA